MAKYKTLTRKELELMELGICLLNALVNWRQDPRHAHEMINGAMTDNMLPEYEAVLKKLHLKIHEEEIKKGTKGVF